MINLTKELTLANDKIKKQKIDEEELKFLELNLIYGEKCKKNFYNNLYKLGTTEYRACVLNKGPQRNKKTKITIQQIKMIDLTGINLRELVTPSDGSDPAWSGLLP